MAVNQSFPAKIYQILENESSDIIRWNEDGQSFRIVDHGRFEREIVPKYFRHNQISSVQRQLNLYGFKCISRGELRRSFFHPKFKRGDWEVVKKLTRYVPPKKPLPYQDYGPFNPAKGNAASEFAQSASTVVVKEEDSPGALQQMSTLHQPSTSWVHTAAGTMSAISAAANAAGFVQQQMNMAMSVPYGNNVPVNSARSNQPSELAMRLGFNVAPKPNGPLMASNMGIYGGMQSNSSAQHPNGYGHCNNHPSSSDFDFMKDFDFFDTFHYDDIISSEVGLDQGKQCSNSATPSSADSVVTNSSAATEVVPVLPGSTTEKKDACCMTDLVFSEKHGGFIYSSSRH